MKTFITITFAAVILFGCSDNTATKPETSAPTTTANIESTCPDDGPKLPITNICTGRAVNYMNIVVGDAPQIPENCDWVVNETTMAGGILLYLAARCNGKTARLDYAGGARFAHLGLGWSAVANEAMPDTVLIKVTGSEPEAPQSNMLFYARQAIDNDVEAAKCSVRSAEIEGWPVDALVVDVSVKEAAKEPKDGPRAACGPFGLDEDNTSYWRIFQGFSWWFEYTQDNHQDIDPRSLTLITSDSNGGWNTVEQEKQ